jgi:hypothetical protein
MRIGVLMLSVLLLGAAAPEVYKWTDDRGVVHYTDKPPKKGAKPVQLPPLQSYESPAMPAPPPAAPEAPPPAKVSVQIVSPPAEETFRDTTVPVAVVVSPSLASGQQLLYFLDSAPNGTPTVSTSRVFADLERGSHDIAVAVLDARGRELSRASVKVFLMPPVAKRK